MPSFDVAVLHNAYQSARQLRLNAILSVSAGMAAEAEDVTLRLWLSSRVQLRGFRQLSPTAANLTADVSSLGHNTVWTGGELRDYHLELVLDPAPPGTELLAARFTVERQSAEGERVVLATGLVKAVWERANLPQLPPEVVDHRSAHRVRPRFPQKPPEAAPPLQRPVHAGPGQRVPPPVFVVNTGFAEALDAGLELPPDTTLSAGWGYWFWLDIGVLVQQSIEVTPMSMPRWVTADARLTVALYSFPGELEIHPASSVGVLALGRDRTSLVLQQPSTVEHPSRLFFPVRTMGTPGVARMRCHIYWEQVLVQSRVISVQVTPTPEHRERALTSTVDFRMADPDDVHDMPSGFEHSASLLLNDDGRGTHALRVLAKDGGNVLRAEASISGHSLASTIRLARGALSRVAWGSEEPWGERFSYRYEHPPSVQQTTDDLITLAVNGFRLHHLLMRSLGRSAGGAYDMADRVGAALAEPGFVQIALKEGAQHVLPAAMLYDLPLDTNAPHLALCSDFLASYRSGQLHGSACLRGQCGQARVKDRNVVCPGGFWGFRHALGLPVSLGGAPVVPAALPHDGGVRLTGGVYQDFASTAAHTDALRGLLPWSDYRLGEDRESTLTGLEGDPQVVYFYCHGGVSGEVPYLQVGRRGGQSITPDNLYERRLRWARTRPLVFLNGCRTTDLEPERAIDFVSFFVEDALACGVIGTEITVFEQMADQFAEVLLGAFLVHGEPIGAAVLRARISLLSSGNPLGLAYIPFVTPSITMSPPRAS